MTARAEASAGESAGDRSRFGRGDGLAASLLSLKLLPIAVIGSLLSGALLLSSCNNRILFDVDGCDQDQECPLSNLHCDTATGTCVACTEDVHCVQADRNRCDPGSHRCAECVIDSDCGLTAGHACRENHCVTLCRFEGNDSACMGLATPHCEADVGFCVACEKENRTCALASGPGPICNVQTGLCVACRSDANCGGTNPRCDKIAGYCVECLQSGDCAPAAPFCDPSTSMCTASGR